jgi:hypothetical protein
MLAPRPASADEEAAEAAPSQGAEGGEAPKPLSAKEQLLAKRAWDFEVPFNIEKVPLSKFKGKVTLVVNSKSDDPEALNQIPGLTYLTNKYAKEGLRILVFTTEQVRLRILKDSFARVRRQDRGVVLVGAELVAVACTAFDPAWRS